MINRNKIFIFVILFFIILSFIYAADANAYKKKKNYTPPSNTSSTYYSSYVYKAPSRYIEVKPYASFLYAKKIYENEIDDQLAYGGGLKVRAQVYGGFGYTFNVAVNKIKPVEPSAEEALYQDQEKKESNYVALFVGGFYYSVITIFGDLRFDACYGAIAAGTNSMTLFMPGVELRRKISKQVYYNFEVGYPIANDWMVNLDFKENYTSFLFSAGLGFLF